MQSKNNFFFVDFYSYLTSKFCSILENRKSFFFIFVYLKEKTYVIILIRLFEFENKRKSVLFLLKIDFTVILLLKIINVFYICL